MKIKHYTVIETLYENRRTLIYKALSGEGDSVAIKTIKDPSDPVAMNKLYREFSIGQAVGGVYDPRYIELIEEEKLYLIQSFESGSQLIRLIPEGGMEIETFLAYALSICEALSYLHEHRILHLDLNPTNLLCDEVRKKVKLLDFGESVSSAPVQKTIKKNLQITGGGAYSAPEQTGLSNQAIDWRSDLYALGVIFYEMLSGHLPFEGENPLQMAHAHLAQNPKELHEFRTAIPHTLSAVVQKLLAKEKEERYQSAWSLRYDLQRFSLEPSSDFPLGSQDLPDRLTIPRKLYGREREFDALKRKILGSVGDKPELIMISGYSGIGKSSFIDDLGSVIGERNGRFVKGKFDQYNKTTSYVAFVQAFRKLIRILETTSGERKQQEIERLAEVLGESKNVLMKIIPELKGLLRITHIPPIESAQMRNQLLIAIERFLGFFATKEEPLILFLDDMQWADTASLEVLELIFASTRLKSLVILGAYRSNEVHPSHPMKLALGRIAQRVGTIEEVELLPLEVDAINQLLSETLNIGDVDALGELLIHKTEGNPFFLRQFIYTLEKQELLRFDKETRGWKWDIDKIRNESLTSNVIDHLILKITTMSADAQTVIQTASLIGDTFEEESVASLCRLEKESIPPLWAEVLREGLIERVSEEEGVVGNHYRFVHDKIRQAAYSMLSPEKKQMLHLKRVEDFLRMNTSTDKEILNVAKHIVEVADRIDPKKSRRVLELLVRASSLAKEALAYEEAIAYAQSGLVLLPEKGWECCYKEAFSIHLNLLDSLSRTRSYEEVTPKFDELLANPLLCRIDRARIYNLRLMFHFTHGKLVESIEDGRIALESLDQPIPDDPSELTELKNKELEWLESHIGVIEELSHLPLMEDERIELCMEVLVNMGIPAFVSRQDMFGVVAFTMARLSVQFGNCSVSPYGYMLCGMILGAGFNRFEQGYQYGQVAMALQERFNNLSIECKLLRVYGAYVASWVQPHELTLGILYKAYVSGIENGDFSYAAYCVNHIFTREFLSSLPLDVLEQKAISYQEFITEVNEPSILQIQNLLVNIPRCLRGNTAALNSLSSDDFDEQKAVEDFKRIRFNTLLAYYYIYKLQICYLHEFYDEAVLHAQSAQEYLGNIKGNVLESEWVFYYALSLFRGGFGKEFSGEDRELLEGFEQRFSLWSTLSPENFRPKYLLIQGIIRHLRGDAEGAFASFDQALEEEDRSPATLAKGVTLELIALCWDHRKNGRIAKMYLQEAYTVFYDLKAISKAKLIFNGQGKRFSHDVSNRTMRVQTPQNPADLNIFDEETIVKATQLISGKVNRSELIEKFIHIIAQSFGIQMGGLILKEGDALYLEGVFDINRTPKIVIDHQPLESVAIVPKTLINHVLATNKAVMVEDAMNDGRFAMDPAIIERKIISVICAPIFLKEELIGLVYMENNLIKGFFDHTREKVLNILLTQTAVTLELENLYSHDKLTGSLSRQKLDEVLQKNDFSALLLINISDLDSINSTYGYATGDEVLKRFVRFLEGRIDEDATLYRLSSDEFAIILPKNSVAEKEVVASEIIKALQEEKFDMGAFVIHLTCSIGITQKSGEGAAESALVRAHAAMKEARQSGTNKFLTYSPESLFIKKQKNNLEWMLRVKEALSEGRIVPFFQPIIDNTTKEIYKYECLARLIEKEEVISPFYFLEPARLSGMMPKLTEMMLRKSFDYFQDKPYRFSINISEEDLKEGNLPPLLEELSQHYRIDPSRVTLEILENISAHESDASLEQLLELKHQGYKIALDDFGSEKSNFLRLQKLDVDYLKIDGSYIRDIHENPNNLNICKTIVHLAESLQCEVIAEFVHSEEVYAVVRSIGVRYSQGYYFGAPVDKIL